MQTVSRPRLSGKVAAKPSEGASVSRNGRMEINMSKTKKRFLQTSIKYLPVILERSEESGHRLQELNILTCVRTLAPIASQSSALPSVFGGSWH